MSELIISLASAYRSLLNAITAGGDEKAISASARKVEANLMAALEGATDEDLGKLTGPIMNTGSLKALKMIPEDARPSNYVSYDRRPDTQFIMSQPAAYLTEAQKRGFTLSQDAVLSVFKDLSEIVGNHSRFSKEAMLLAQPVNGWMASRIITLLMEMEKDAAERTAPLAVKLLKSALKAHPDQIAANVDALFGIYDPSAAHETLYRVIAIYALLGAKAPAKEVFESDEMERLAKQVFSRDGRKALKDNAGSLEEFLAGGHKTPPAIIREFERKRLSFRAPSDGTRRSYYR